MITSLFRTRTTAAADRARFEQQMRDTHKQAYRFALRLCGSSVDAEDLVQETYLRAFRFYARYDESLPFVNWLYRIMSNAHIDSMRRKGRLRVVSMDQPAPNASSPFEIADSSPSVEREMVDSAMSGDVEMALAKMTPEFRTAVLLADVEGMAYGEIADLMGTSVGTVRSRIHRGRKQLRSCLKGREPKTAREEELV